MKNGINKLIKKVGLDKIAHFLVGGWVTTYGLSFAWWAGILAALFITLLEIFKEKKIDDTFDKVDVIYTEAGVGTAFLLKLLQCLVLV